MSLQKKKWLIDTPHFLFLDIKMPQFLPLLTGLCLASAVTYTLKETVSRNQSDMHKCLEDVKTTLDNAVTPKSNPKYSPKYVSDRLVPSVKDSWNNQLINATHSLVKIDFGGKAKKFLDEHFK
ncbi:unnamed protein product [Rhizopus stolonifer]